MATTLTNGATVLTLSDHLLWVDEFDWSAVAESREYGVAGTLLIDRRLRLAGRPITLAGSDSHGHMPRSVANTLYAWRQQLNPTLSLLLRGTVYPVAFDYSQPFQVVDMVDYADPLPTDLCYFTLRLIALG